MNRPIVIYQFYLFYFGTTIIIIAVYFIVYTYETSVVSHGISTNALGGLKCFVIIHTHKILVYVYFAIYNLYLLITAA